MSDELVANLEEFSFCPTKEQLCAAFAQQHGDVADFLQVCPFYTMEQCQRFNANACAANTVTAQSTHMQDDVGVGATGSSSSSSLLCPAPCSMGHFRMVWRAPPHLRQHVECNYMDRCYQPACVKFHYELIVTDVVERKRIFCPLIMDSERHPPEWINADVGRLNMTLLGKFDAIMMDPPWRIVMDVPYQTMSDDDILGMNVQCLQDDGLLFLWVTTRAIELGRRCLRHWGYRIADELIWVKINQLHQLQTSGRTGHWLNHSKEHMLVGIKGSPRFHGGLEADVLIAEPRETSRKPIEAYEIIERMLNMKHEPRRCLEVFGREHNRRPGWLTVGNEQHTSWLQKGPIRTKLEEFYGPNIFATPMLMTNGFASDLPLAKPDSALTSFTIQSPGSKMTRVVTPRAASSSTLQAASTAKTTSVVNETTPPFMSAVRGGGGGTDNSGGAQKPMHWTVKSLEHSINNNYSQHFVNTAGQDRPQNYIRTEASINAEDSQQELRHAIATLVHSTNTPAMARCADLDQPDHVLNEILEKQQFDVVLIDPPWAEYASRAPGASVEVWNLMQLKRLPIAQITATPSFVFLWCGSSADQVGFGRELLRHWGFYAVEDLCLVHTNNLDANCSRGLLHFERATGNEVFNSTYEHCLVAVKESRCIRRDRQKWERGDDVFFNQIPFVVPNLDTDVIVDEMPRPGDFSKPLQVYDLIERLCRGRRRLELFGRDRNVRSGWVTIGKEITGAMEAHHPFSMAEYRRLLNESANLEAARTVALQKQGDHVDSHTPTTARATPTDLHRLLSDNIKYPHILPFRAEIERLRPKSPRLNNNNSANNSANHNRRNQFRRAQQQGSPTPSSYSARGDIRESPQPARFAADVPYHSADRSHPSPVHFSSPGATYQSHHRAASDQRLPRHTFVSPQPSRSGGHNFARSPQFATNSNAHQITLKRKYH